MGVLTHKEREGLEDVFSSIHPKSKIGQPRELLKGFLSHFKKFEKNIFQSLCHFTRCKRG